MKVTLKAGVVALLVAILVAGTATSATLITGSQIKAHSITARNVKAGSLTGAEVKDRSLTPADFAGSVQGPTGPVGAQGIPGPAGTPGTPGISNLTTVTTPGSIPANVQADVVATCPTGTTAIGTGFDSGNTAVVFVRKSGTTVVGSFVNFNAAAEPVSVQAICATVSGGG
jgi:hypothetical protein